MARIRTIKPDFYISESLAEVSLTAERTFGGLITQVDDEGRYRHNAAILHGAIWALRPEHTPADVEQDLVQLENAGLICCYTANGKHYLHLITFGVHQKISHPTASKLPACPLHNPAPAAGNPPKVSGEAPEDDGKTPESSDSGQMGSNETGSGAGSDDRLMQVKEIPAQGSLPFDAGESAAQGSNGKTPEVSGGIPLGSGSGSGSGSGKNLCSPEVSAGASSIKQTSIKAHFEAFWKPWPRKVGKVKAEQAFATAVRKGADPTAIIAACVSYAERQQRAGTPKDKIPHPTTWLNRGSWDDDLDDAVPLPAAPAPTMQPPAYGQPAARPAASCRWCDNGLYERTDGRMARCEHTDQPPAGHPAAQTAGSLL